MQLTCPQCKGAVGGERQVLTAQDGEVSACPRCGANWSTDAALREDGLVELPDHALQHEDDDITAAPLPADGEAPGFFGDRINAGAATNATPFSLALPEPSVKRVKPERDVNEMLREYSVMFRLDTKSKRRQNARLYVGGGVIVAVALVSAALLTDPIDRKLLDSLSEMAATLEMRRSTATTYQHLMTDVTLGPRGATDDSRALASRKTVSALAATAAARCRARIVAREAEKRARAVAAREAAAKAEADRLAEAAAAKAAAKRARRKTRRKRKPRPRAMKRRRQLPSFD